MLYSGLLGGNRGWFGWRQRFWLETAKDFPEAYVFLSVLKLRDDGWGYDIITEVTGMTKKELVVLRQRAYDYCMRQNKKRIKMIFEKSIAERRAFELWRQQQREKIDAGGGDFLPGSAENPKKT